MDEQRWKEIEAVYMRALDAPDRDAFLREACRDDPSLRSAVEFLLESDPSTTSLFGSLARPHVPVESEDNTLAEGTHLGHYRIEGLIGRGGSSDVYKAFDTSLKRAVALKVFPHQHVTEAFRARFATEAQAAAALNHPNIATVYEVGESAAPWFIAMEYIDGRTLRDVFDDPACSLTERLQYLAQAAGALACAHAKGIAHCDLKPDNIMVSRDGLVKVLDFGLVRLDGAAARLGIEGTIGYMSPEQVAGSSIDVKSDVFSFGCILFEMVAHRLPFSSTTTTRWLENLAHGTVPRLKSRTTRIPAALPRLIDDCLVRDLNARVTSMEEVHRRLEQMLAPRGVLSRPAVVVAATLLIALGALVAREQLAEPPAGSIAVIPFVSSPVSPENTRMAEGLGDGVIEALMQLPDLKVIARSSSFRFAGGVFDAVQVAESLGVQTLLTGRIQIANGELVVAAELINGSDGTAIWASEYRPRVDGLDDLQARIAREIARRIRSDLTDADERRLGRGVRPNDEAYSLLLRGRYEVSLYTNDSMTRAASYFEQALGSDPTYSLASAELANTYRQLGLFGKLPPGEAMRRAEQSALKAIALDDELADAHLALARIRQDRWQWADAEREFRRAISLSQSLVAARRSLAILLSLLGRDEEAITEALAARDLDPVGVPGAVGVAAVFYNVRQYDRALGILDEALKLDSVAPALWTWTGIVAGGAGDFPRAVTAFEKAIALGDSNASTLCFYAHALAQVGRRDEARRQLEIAERDRALAPKYVFAIVHLALGDREGAIAELLSAYDTREAPLQYIRVESYLTGLMTDPRFLRILALMELPPPRVS